MNLSQINIMKNTAFKYDIFNLLGKRSFNVPEGRIGPPKALLRRLKIKLEMSGFYN